MRKLFFAVVLGLVLSLASMVSAGTLFDVTFNGQEVEKFELSYEVTIDTMAEGLGASPITFSLAGIGWTLLNVSTLGDIQGIAIAVSQDEYIKSIKFFLATPAYLPTE